LEDQRTSCREFAGPQQYPVLQVPCIRLQSFERQTAVFLMNSATGVGEFIKLPLFYHKFRPIASTLKIIFSAAPQSPVR
jgi:hypothetical protein